MIRQKIKLDGTTMNLNFTLSSNDDFYGQQQEIDNLVQAVSNSLINPENDVEERRFKYNPNNSTAILNFQFYDQINNTYSSSFTAAGFTSDEITNNRNNILNSFFILDFYDSFDVNSQNKIFTTYLTKIVNNFTGEITPSYLILLLYITLLNDSLGRITGYSLVLILHVLLTKSKVALKNIFLGIDVFS